jgi:predicted phosphodiesterase
MDAQQLSPPASWNLGALSDTHDVTHRHTAAVDPAHDEMPQFHPHLGDFHIV